VSAVVAEGQKKPAVQGAAEAVVQFVERQNPAGQVAQAPSEENALPPEENFPAGQAFTTPVDWPAKQK
jgi:hypothetical protein